MSCTSSWQRISLIPLTSLILRPCPPITTLWSWWYSSPQAGWRQTTWPSLSSWNIHDFKPLYFCHPETWMPRCPVLRMKSILAPKRHLSSDSKKQGDKSNILNAGDAHVIQHSRKYWTSSNAASNSNFTMRRTPASTTPSLKLRPTPQEFGRSSKNFATRSCKPSHSAQAVHSGQCSLNPATLELEPSLNIHQVSIFNAPSSSGIWCFRHDYSSSR